MTNQSNTKLHPASAIPAGKLNESFQLHHHTLEIQWGHQGSLTSPSPFSIHA